MAHRVDHPFRDGDDADTEQERYGEGEARDGERVGRGIGSSMTWAEAVRIGWNCAAFSRRFAARRLRRAHNPRHFEANI
jgi:hypothetical protein